MASAQRDYSTACTTRWRLSGGGESQRRQPSGIRDMRGSRKQSAGAPRSDESSPGRQRAGLVLTSLILAAVIWPQFGAKSRILCHSENRERENQASELAFFSAGVCRGPVSNCEQTESSTSRLVAFSPLRTHDKCSTEGVGGEDCCAGLKSGSRMHGTSLRCTVVHRPSTLRRA